MTRKIKNDMETAVQEECARQLPLQRGPSQAVMNIKSTASSVVARLSQSSLLSSKLPMDTFSRMSSRLLGEKKRSFCHCPVCRTDVLAYALTNLPPCYCRAEHYGIASQKVDSSALAKAVGAGIRRVTLRPRHPGKGVPEDHKVVLVNFGLELGNKIVPPLIAKLSGACQCELCRHDTLAFGLNQTPSRYGISIEGKLRIPNTALEFIQHELLKTFSAAAEKIATKPRHGGKEEP